MNKLKKIVAAAVAVVLVCVFATSAFAMSYAEKDAQIKAFAAARGIDISSVSLSNEQIDAIAAQKDTLAAQADSLIAAAKSDPGNLQNYVAQATATVSGLGISVSAPSVSINANGEIVATATVNGSTATVAVSTASKDEHPEIGAAIANGTWGKDSTAAAASTANPLVASGSAVIKATGDSIAVALVAAVLAVAGILGLAVRKNASMAV